jgi:hypothetical protein
MQDFISRRTLFKQALGTSAFAVVVGAGLPLAAASAATPLDAADPQAKALGFVTDAGTVAVAANPTFKPGQKCSTCAQYQGKPGDGSAACNIFPGHTVPAGGWCKVWAQKPGA